MEESKHRKDENNEDKQDRGEENNLKVIFITDEEEIHVEQAIEFCHLGSLV